MVPEILRLTVEIVGSNSLHETTTEWYDSDGGAGIDDVRSPDLCLDTRMGQRQGNNATL